jgi:hypothetical protein
VSSRAAGYLLIAAAHLGAAACSSAPPARREPERREEAPAQDPAAIAARIGGDWQFAVDRGGQTTEGWLHFALNAGELVGSLTVGDSYREISKIALKGDKLSWRIERDSVTERYEGTLKGSDMEGILKMSRKAGEGRRGGGSEGEEGSGGRGGRGGYGGRRGGFGRGGGGGRGAEAEIKWRAYRSVRPTPAAAPEPTKLPVVS